jgi:hypothetical protein
MGVILGLASPTASEHNMLLLLLITKEFLNDRLTRQKRTLILRANAERISQMLPDQLTMVKFCMTRSLPDNAGCDDGLSAHFCPFATGGPFCKKCGSWRLLVKWGA